MLPTSAKIRKKPRIPNFFTHAFDFEIFLDICGLLGAKNRIFLEEMFLKKKYQSSYSQLICSTDVPRYVKAHNYSNYVVVTHSI
jgi:hypothetical protein